MTIPPNADTDPAESGRSERFANQALASEYLKSEIDGLGSEVYRVPEETDHEIAALRPAGMGIDIDVLAVRQEESLHSWHLGT